MNSGTHPRWLWLAVVVFLSACATRPAVSPTVSEASWLQHRAALQALTYWQVRGRMAVRTETEGWTAHFDWKQSGEEYLIRLRGPFGQGAVELHGDASCLGELLTDLATRFPRLGRDCLAGDTLRSGFCANLGGRRFVSDPKTRLQPGDCLLILHADAGG